MVFYFEKWREGVKQNMCFGCFVNCSGLMVSCISVVLSMLRSDLKMDETWVTGAFCSGEKREKSTAIQVLLRDLFRVFWCSHHPPRARSTFELKYDSGKTAQVQCDQFRRQKCAIDREGGSANAKRLRGRGSEADSNLQPETPASFCRWSNKKRDCIRSITAGQSPCCRQIDRASVP